MEPSAFDELAFFQSLAESGARALPSDLILTKQVASRPKDVKDIRLLRLLLDEGER